MSGRGSQVETPQEWQSPACAASARTAHACASVSASGAECSGLWRSTRSGSCPVLDGLLGGCAQPDGSEAVAFGEIPDLGGDQEFRQEIAGRRLQHLVRTMAEVVGRDVEACYAEVGGCFGGEA